jgi:hypothetical protein
MIGAIPRASILASQSIENVACYYQYASPVFSSANIVVENNLCQGSNGDGFVLPHTPCSYLDDATRFVSNTAGSCAVGFAFNAGTESCLSAQLITAYNCKIGFIANPPSTNIIKYSQFVLADNGRAMGLRNGFSASDDNTALLTNSWISAIARPSCDYCYGDLATDCTDNEGVRLMVSTVVASTYPSVYGNSLDAILKYAAFDSKAFLTNVTFDNFRQSYPSLSQCHNNVVFKPHPS